MRRKFRGAAGFTLVEALAVLGIAGIALAIGIPWFGAIMRRARVESEARTITMILLEARLQAVQRATSVSVEISTDPGKASYRRPIVFVDTGGTPGAYDAADVLIATAEVAPGAARDSVRIDCRNAPEPSSAVRTIEFVFTPFGSMAASSTAQAVYVGDVAGNVLQVAVPSNATGRVTTTKRLGAGYVGRPWTWS